jgi:hypothetical protein
MLDDFGNGVIIPPPTGIPDGGTEETPFNDNFLIGNVDMHSYPSHFNLHLSPVGGHTAIRMFEFYSDVSPEPSRHSSYVA